VFAVLSEPKIDPARLAGATVVAATQQLEELKNSQSINYCFWILVRIATAARSKDFSQELKRIGIDSDKVTSGLSFVQQVAKTVSLNTYQRNDSTIFTAMAELSLRQILTSNIAAQSPSLFESSQDDVRRACQAISSKQAFSRVARQFYANFLSRIIGYLTEKEISNYIGPDKALASPAHALDLQNAINTYCFESAKLVEDFAAGWFSKNNWETNHNITEAITSRFTSYALEKIRMELRGAKA
jgi:hypothetical protein